MTFSPRRLLRPLCLLFATLAMVAVPAVAQAPAGSSRYVVVLSGSEEPMLANYGATLQEKWGRRLVVLIPDNRVADLRSDATVKYAQPVVDPASVANEAQALSRPLRATETAWSATSWQSGSYSYDGSGNIRGIGADQFAYDPVGRLTQAKLDNRNFAYTYDPLGNRTSITLPGGVSIPSPVNAGTNRLAGATYDAAGNVITLGGSDYTYDALNSMTSVRDNGNWHVALYTASDERLAFCDSGQCTWTVRGADQKPLRVFESASVLNGGTPHTFLWVEDYAYRGSTLLGAAREKAEGGYLLFHPDHLGTPRVLTSTTLAGTQARDMARHDYEPFGLEQTSITQETALKHDRTEPLQYTGHERDDLGGTVTNNSEYLDYMHARYYSPTMGRFLSGDPVLDIEASINVPQKWNRYAYVGNNPLKYTDPTGKDWLAAWLLGESYRNVSTWDVIFNRDTLSDINRGRQEWAEDHRAATHGFSPVPTTKTEVVMSAMFIGPLKGPTNKLAGMTFGKIGTLVEPFAGEITGVTTHAAQRMAQRGVTTELMQGIVSKPLAVFAQRGGTTLFLSEAGAVALSSEGKVVTTYTAKEFTKFMKDVVTIMFEAAK